MELRSGILILHLVAKVGNIGVDFERNKEYKQKVSNLVLSGIEVTFITYKDKFIQVNAVSSVIDEYKIADLGGIMN